MQSGLGGAAMSFADFTRCQAPGCHVLLIAARCTAHRLTAVVGIW